MGKLTTAQADDLTKSGVITKTARAKMESNGLITTRRKTQYHIQVGKNQFLSPKMYFSGLRETDITDDTKTQETINAIRDGWTALLKKHCTTNNTNEE